jgi:hypothetical protein
VNIANNTFLRNRNSNKYYSKLRLALDNITVNSWYKATTTRSNKTTKYNTPRSLNNNLDISHDIVNLEDGTADLQFWGLRTPNRSGQHQSLIWCNPRFYGRGDNSVYNRPFIGLKTIVTVFGGFLNSLIAKTSINHSIFHTFFGDQNSWSLAIFNCFRPFCFNLRGSSRG